MTAGDRARRRARCWRKRKGLAGLDLGIARRHGSGGRWEGGLEAIDGAAGGVESGGVAVLRGRRAGAEAQALATW